MPMVRPTCTCMRGRVGSGSFAALPEMPPTASGVWMKDEGNLPVNRVNRTQCVSYSTQGTCAYVRNGFSYGSCGTAPFR